MHYHGCNRRSTIVLEFVLVCVENTFEPQSRRISSRIWMESREAAEVERGKRDDSREGKMENRAREEQRNETWRRKIKDVGGSEEWDESKDRTIDLIDAQECLGIYSNIISPQSIPMRIRFSQSTWEAGSETDALLSSQTEKDGVIDKYKWERWRFLIANECLQDEIMRGGEVKKTCKGKDLSYIERAEGHFREKCSDVNYLFEKSF